MIDVTKASRETKDEYILASEEFEEINDLADTFQASERFEEARAKLRAECAPKLRSRAEVDAEIATIVRAHHEANQGGISCVLPERERSLKRLCAEPTAEEPDELDLSEHEVCSCEETEELKRRLSQANGRLKLWRGIAQAREEMYDKLKTAIEALDQ